MIEILLYISIFWLVGTGGILLWNIFHFARINEEKTDISKNLFISVCIPARNEEASLPRCLESILNQDYKNYEVWVLDDHSTDQTRQVAKRFKVNHSHLNLIEGAEKPNDWLGKPWACHQLGQHAKGEIVLFLDADTWMEPNALKKIAAAFHKEKLDAVTVWPEQQFGTEAEKIILPLVYYVLVTLLPAKLIEFSPAFGSPKLRERIRVSLSAACGQCFAFRRTAYQKIGGHASVKDKVVEDVELAKRLRKRDMKLKMYNGINFISCRMYNNHREIWQGLRKNFLAGFNYNLFAFSLAAILHLIVFLLPPFILIYSIIDSDLYLTTLSGASLILIYLHRLILSRMFKWNTIYGLTHIPAVLWFQLLALRCIIDRLTGSKAVWKGREI